MRRMIFIVLSMWLFAGCHMEGEMAGRYSGINGLRLNPKNSVGMDITKVICRVPLGIISFGFSESRYGIERDMERSIDVSRDQLIMQRGTPGRSASMSDGGTALEYFEEHRGDVTGICGDDLGKRECDFRLFATRRIAVLDAADVPA